MRFELLEPRQLLTAIVPTGAEFGVNTYTTGDQAGPKTASDSAGDFVLVWQSPQDGNSNGIYAQRFDSTGAAQGSEFRVNTTTAGNQETPAVAMDSAGDFVIAWQSPDGSGYGIYAKRYNSAGVVQGSEFRVNTYTTSQEKNPSIAMDAAGDFVVAWQRYNGPSPRGTQYDIYAQRYNAAGTAQGSEFEVNTLITGGQQTLPSVAMDSAGDFVIVFESTSFNTDNYGVRYNSAGVAQGVFIVDNYTGTPRSAASIAMDSTGDFVIVWTASPGTPGIDVQAQRYNSAGTPQGGKILVSGVTANYPPDAVAMDAAGDFVVTWQSDGDDGSKYGIYAQAYDSSGNAQGSKVQANTYTANSQESPTAVMPSSGDFLIAWQSAGEDGSGYGIYAQQFEATSATQLAVTASPASLSAGGTTTVTITAEDASNNVVTNYSDTVTLSDSLGFASFSPVSFTSGQATVTATLNAGGSQTITATDSKLGISGTSDSISVTPVYAATATDNSPVLNIQLGTGAQVGIVSLGTSYQLTLASGDWSAPTSDPLVSGDGTPVLTIASSGISAFTGGIDIADPGSAGGDTLAFSDSGSSAYSNSFNINLASANQAGALTFGGATLLSGSASLSADVAGGITVSPGAELFGGTGSITLDAAATLAISSGAVVTTTGAVTLAAGEIEIATGSDPAMVGASVSPASFSTTPSTKLEASFISQGHSSVIAYDPLGDYGLYEASYYYDNISEFAPGSTAATTSFPNAAAGRPTSLLFDSSGDLFVGNTSGGVTEYAPGGTTPIATFDASPGLADVDALAIDPSGHLFAADASNNVIAEFDPVSGTTPITTITAGLDSPTAMVFDSAGKLYVANSNNGNGSGTVTEYAAGSTIPSVTLTGLKFGAFSNERGALALDSSGNLYVADYGNNVVDVFAPGATTPSAQLTGLPGPEAVMIDAQAEGDLLVANRGNNTVSIFKSGATTASATISNNVSFPGSVTLDPAGDLFVSAAGSYGYGYGYGYVSEFSLTAAKKLVPAASVTIESYDPANSIQVGTTTNPPASGLYLTSAELGEIYTAAAGTLTFGDTSQTGNVTFTTVKPATSGAMLDVVESTTGGGAIILDADGGTGTALDGNGGLVSLTPGTGGVQAAVHSTVAVPLSTDGFSVTPGSIVNLSLGFAPVIGAQITLIDNTATPAASNPISGVLANLADGATVKLMYNGATYFFTASYEGGDGNDLVLTNVPDEVTMLVVSAAPSSLTAGGSTSVTISAEDTFGDIVTTFADSVTLSDSLGNAAFGAVSFSDGVATVTATLSAVGPQTITATDTANTSVTGVSGTLSVTSATPTQFVITGQPPATVVAGGSFDVTASFEDAAGNIVSSYSGVAQIALQANPGSSTLSGTTMVTFSGGVATFSGLSLDKVGGGYTLVATSGTLTSAASNSISVTPGAATQLIISSAPSSAISGSPFSFTVTAEDAQGNVDTNFGGSETVAISSNPAGGTLSGTLMATASAGMATFSGLSIDNVASGYMLGVTSAGLPTAQTGPIQVTPATLIINGSPGDVTTISLSDPTYFSVVIDGGIRTIYNSKNVDKVIYNGPAGASELDYDDAVAGQVYTATQTFSSAVLTRSDGFELDSHDASSLYIYVADQASRATVDASGGSRGSYFVGAPGAAFSYLSDPALRIYSQLSGFGSETVAGPAAGTYAYLYSTSHASTVASPSQTTITAGSVSETLSSFAQLYVVGAADGTDSVTLDSAGGAFVSTPQFSYVTGNSAGGIFLLAALYAAKVSAQSAGTGDTASFYSYPGNAFTGAAGDSSLSGATTNLLGSSVQFIVQATGYSTASVFESGAGSDTAQLISSGGGSLISTDTATTLTAGGSTITVNTFFVLGGQLLPVASQTTVTGNHDGTDTAYLYDSPGANSLVAGGSTSTLTSSFKSISLDKFGTVYGEAQYGTSDTDEKVSALDFALQLVGNWVAA